MKKKVSDRLVQQLMEKWWVRLGLGDWRIRWQWDTQDSIDKNNDTAGSPAYTERWPYIRAATVHMSSEVAWMYPEVSNPDVDLEAVILHELSHLYFAPYDVPLDQAHNFVRPYLPDATRAFHWRLLVDAREGYVDAFVELLLREERAYGND